MNGIKKYTFLIKKFGVWRYIFNDVIEFQQLIQYKKGANLKLFTQINSKQISIRKFAAFYSNEITEKDNENINKFFKIYFRLEFYKYCFRNDNNSLNYVFLKIFLEIGKIIRSMVCYRCNIN